MNRQKLEFNVWFKLNILHNRFPEYFRIYQHCISAPWTSWSRPLSRCPAACSLSWTRRAPSWQDPGAPRTSFAPSPHSPGCSAARRWSWSPRDPPGPPPSPPRPWGRPCQRPAIWDTCNKTCDLIHCSSRGPGDQIYLCNNKSWYSESEGDIMLRSEMD